MYTLPKGPSKFVASARRGPPRQLGFEGYNRDKSRTPSSEENDSSAENMSNPRPTFQYKRPVVNRRPPPPVSHESNITENHLDVAQLLMRQWKKVNDSLKSGKGDSYEIYREKEPNRDLEDFQPFLEKMRYGTYSNSLGKSPS